MTANRWKRAGAAVTKSIVVLLTATAVLLTFFLLRVSSPAPNRLSSPQNLSL